MENLALVSAKPVLGLGFLPNPRSRSTKQCCGIPLLTKKPTGSVSTSRPISRIFLFAFSSPNSRRKLAINNNVKGNNGVELFASTCTTADSRSGEETTSVGVNPQAYTPPPPAQFGSPLFWIGVGVGLSALFSFVASRLKKYAMQQAFKTLMGQMGPQSNQFNNGTFPPASPFSYGPPSTPGQSTSPGFPFTQPSASGPNASTTSTGFTYKSPSSSGPSISNMSAASSGPSEATSPAASGAAVTVDVSAKVEAAETGVVKDETEVKTEGKKYAFVDVSPEETSQKSQFEDFKDSSSSTSSEEAKFAEVVQNGAASEQASTSKEGTASDWSQSTREGGSVLSVEALEKMMEDPTVQKMVFPHLPEEMRNPATFKWMLQNPVYRQQLQEMLDNMGGSTEWDNQMMENLKNFNLNSPEVKQQFDQLGLTPEEVISKIMANPDIAMAFQNPRVQQAIMECSQNPLSIAKYQNDKEVMDVFNKMAQLFPGSMGPAGF